jgi:signal transduction histidine kinase
MADTLELLRRVPMFEGLPDDQINWFLSQSEELHLKPGDFYTRQGDPADRMSVVLEGQLEVRGELGGESIVIPMKAGDVTGKLPFSRMKLFPLSGRAITDSFILRFPAAQFPELVQRMPELTQRLVGLMSDRIRETTRFEQQRDRLAALGKLSAGLAHELNNPASAAKRATSQLLAASDLEDQLDSLLRSHGQNDLWQLAADLAKKNFKPESLEQIFAALDAETARAALVRISSSVEIADLLNQIESSTSRISDLVGAIKEYTFMDQSPIQNVDIVKTLETTLTILNHKLKSGVTVRRDYQKIPLLVNSFGSELNQVWTNIIDNAIDAMGGKGELRVRTYREDNCVVVEIADNGPGISAEVEPHIFEPFFTTKAVGEGTGLGLDAVQRIVKKHRGSIQVQSEPGDTRFQVWLPLSENAS